MQRVGAATVKFGDRDARLVMTERLTDDPDLEID